MQDIYLIWNGLGLIWFVLHWLASCRCSKVHCRVKRYHIVDVISSSQPCRGFPEGLICMISPYYLRLVCWCDCRIPIFKMYVVRCPSMMLRYTSNDCVQPPNKLSNIYIANSTSKITWTHVNQPSQILRTLCSSHRAVSALAPHQSIFAHLIWANTRPTICD